MIEQITDRKTFKGALYIILGTAILLYHFGLFQKIGHLLGVIAAIGLIGYGVVIADWHIAIYNAINKLIHKVRK